MSGPTFTDRELDIMAILWDRGPATVPDVRRHLADELAYTTVQTILRTLEAKGYVAHDEDGRFHRYRATVERADAEQSAVNRLLTKIFRGSPELLLSQLVSQRNLSEDQVRRMRRLLDDYQPGGGD